MSSSGPNIRISPKSGIAGGEVTVDCDGFDTSEPAKCAVWFASEQAHIVALGPQRIVALVPELKQSGPVEVVLESPGKRSVPATFVVGKRIAEDLHPVTNPAFDPDEGALFVTRSGSRGEQLPVSLFRIEPDGKVSEF